MVQRPAIHGDNLPYQLLDCRHVKIESFFSGCLCVIPFLPIQMEVKSGHGTLRFKETNFLSELPEKKNFPTTSNRISPTLHFHRSESFSKDTFPSPPESRSLSDLLWKRRAKRRHETRCYLHSANVIYFHLTSWKVLLSLEKIIEKNLQSAFGLIPPGVGIMKIPIIPESVLNWQHGKNHTYYV